MIFSKNNCFTHRKIIHLELQQKSFWINDYIIKKFCSFVFPKNKVNKTFNK